MARVRRTLNLSDRTVARFREFGRDIFEDVAGGTGGASVVSVNGWFAGANRSRRACHLQLF